MEFTKQNKIALSSSNSCGSWGLPRPVLILQRAPSVEDGLEVFDEILVLPEVPELWPQILIHFAPARYNVTFLFSICFAPTKPITFGKPPVMAIIPCKVLEAPARFKPFSWFLYSCTCCVTFPTIWLIFYSCTFNFTCWSPQHFLISYMAGLV